MSARTTVMAMIGVATMFASAIPVAARQDRADLIDQARAAADEAVSRALYFEAANPQAPDSLWAVSVYEIAQIMLDLGQDEGAAAWIRWVARHGEWGIDDLYFAPSLVTLVEELASGVSPDGDPASGAAATEWRWPDDFAATDPGSLEVSATDPAAELTVSVAGQDVEPGALLELPPGTYDLVVSAEGYDPLTVQREVLPGVGTVVAFDLAPVLSDATTLGVAQSVVRLRSGAGAAAVCRNGVAVRDGFVVTSLSALAGATQVEVLPASGPTLGGAVVETDPADDLAVLSVQDLAAPSLQAGPATGTGFGWSIYRSGCDAGVDVFRTRVDAAGQPAATIPAGALGSPLIDRAGLLTGLVASGGRISPIDRIGEAVEEAAAQFEGGGFPMIWVAVGAAAVGGAAALLLGGGGGDTPTPQPTTGSIVITLPSG